MSPTEGQLLKFIELTDAEIVAIWERLTGDKTLIDFARACIEASIKLV